MVNFEEHASIRQAPQLHETRPASEEAGLVEYWHPLGYSTLCFQTENLSSEMYNSWNYNVFNYKGKCSDCDSVTNQDLLIPQQDTVFDSALYYVISIWGRLPDDVKSGIVSIIKAINDE